MAVELNQFRPRLEATLILHVGLGKDHFVTASANYGTFAELHLHTPRLFLLFLSFLSHPFFIVLLFYFLGGGARVSLYWRIYARFHCVIRANVLREHAFLPDPPQGADKGGEIDGRPACGRGR